MQQTMKEKIVSILDSHRRMTIATLRPDGWPQASTVGYGNEGMTIYFLCGRDSQKTADLAKDDRVSLTVDHGTGPATDAAEISMAARAQRVTDRAEAEKAMRLVASRRSAQESPTLQPPDPDDVSIFRVTSFVIRSWTGRKASGG